MVLSATVHVCVNTSLISGRWLRGFLALSVLPPDCVSDGFVALISEMPFGEDFSDFADYALPNTTNSAEGFHRQFNAQFTGHHPNIYVLIESLLEIQASTYVRMNNVQKGVPAPPLCWKQEYKTTMTYEAYTQLKSGATSMYQFLIYAGSLAI